MPPKTVSVGASRPAQNILGRLNAQWRDPAGMIIRVWGFLMLAFVAYMQFGFQALASDNLRILSWLLSYLGYILLMEFIRWRWSSQYDRSDFRFLRILFYLAAITWLVAIAPHGRYIVAFFYTVPVFAAIVYFSRQVWLWAGIFLIAVIGLYFASSLVSLEQPLQFEQFLAIVAGLAILSFALHLAHRKSVAKNDLVTTISRDLHQFLDIHELMNEILNTSREITGAQHSMLILVDPKRRGYVIHASEGFDLRPGFTIEDVAHSCTVLKTGEPYHTGDIESEFGDQSIYARYFTCRPRSIAAEPILNGRGELLGVVVAAHDGASRFDPITRKLLTEFASLVGSAVNNSLAYRRVRLDASRSQWVGDKLAEVNDELEIARLLVEEARCLVPEADTCVLHRLDPETEALFVVAISTDGASVVKDQLADLSGEVQRNLLHLGAGIAGHSLSLREPILVGDVDKHSWFVPSPNGKQFKSLLVAPLVDPTRDRLFGTVSLQAARPGVFTADDEANLASLAYRGGLALARERDFDAWRRHGGVMMRIFDEIRLFNIESGESSLYQQIVTAATQVLDFKLARLRILEARSGELITVALAGIPEAETTNLLGQRMPKAELMPLLNDQFRAERSFLIPNHHPGWRKIADQHFYIPSETSHNQGGWHAYDALVTPLYNQSGDMIGLLSLDQPENQSKPSSAMIEAVGVFASGAAWAIELARAHQRLDEQYHRTASFIESIGEELVRSRDLGAVGQVVVQVGARLLSAEGCNLYLVKGETLELAYSTFLEGTGYIGRSKRVSTAPGSGLTAYVAATGKPLLFNHGTHEHHPAWAHETAQLQHIPSQKCLSLLLVPVKNSSGEITGVISMENKRSGSRLSEFDFKDLERLESLARQFALAQDIIGRYQNIQNWERKGMEDDLHDLVNWYHSGVVLRSDTIQYWLSQGNIKKVEELMPGLIQHAYTTLDQLKTIHTGLISAYLETENFKEALQRMVDAWSRRAGRPSAEPLPITLNCPEAVKMPISLHNTLLRIANEALANAIIHSGVLDNPSIDIKVTLEQANGSVVLQVQDLGRGFDPSHEGYGISRMHQLVTQLKNQEKIPTEIEIHSAPQAGTSVLVRAWLGEV